MTLQDNSGLLKSGSYPHSLVHRFYLYYILLFKVITEVWKHAEAQRLTAFVSH